LGLSYLDHAPTNSFPALLLGFKPKLERHIRGVLTELARTLFFPTAAPPLWLMVAHSALSFPVAPFPFHLSIPKSPRPPSAGACDGRRRGRRQRGRVTSARRTSGAPAATAHGAPALLLPPWEPPLLRTPGPPAPRLCTSAPTPRALHPHLIAAVVSPPLTSDNPLSPVDAGSRGSCLGRRQVAVALPPAEPLCIARERTRVRVDQAGRGGTRAPGKRSREPECTAPLSPIHRPGATRLPSSRAPLSGSQASRTHPAHPHAG
jgi:hypothetical protein